MKFISIVTILLGLTISCLATENVVTLSGGSFDDFIKKNDFVVAEFYAPWCGHCKKLAPEFEKAATMLKESGESIVLAKIDATEKDNEDLARRFNIGGYPTLKIFRNGNVNAPIDYDGPREADGIVSFLKRQSGPATRLVSKADLTSLLESQDFVIVGVFPSGEKSAEFKIYAETAEALRADYELVHVTNAADVPNGYCDKSACSSPTLLVAKKYDNPLSTIKIDTKTTAEAVIEFIGGAVTPSVIELNQEPRFKKALATMFEDQVKPKVLVFGDKADAASYASLRDAIAAAQTLYSEDMFFLLVDASNGGAMNYFGLVAEDLPAVALHQLKPDAKFIEKHVTPSSIAAFLAKYKSGKLERHLKSEDVPEKSDAPLKVLVGTTFNDLVFGSGKDVLIEFYAPWCGHCKKLAPTYEALAEKYATDDAIMIAKMDATANDIPSDRFEVRGFPTIFFYQAATDRVLPFNGDRSEESFIDFIKRNRSSGPGGDEGLVEGDARDEL